MNKRNTILLILTLALFSIFVIFTILVRENVTHSGFYIRFISNINEYFLNQFPYNKFFYYLTQVLGYLAILICLFLVVVGINQLVKRKNLKKVDQKLIALGLMFGLVVVTYIFFEIVIINYRPIVINLEDAEASYPSSHTMLGVVVFILASIYLPNLINDKRIVTSIRIILYSLTLIMVIGRIISGVHWISDIIGGLIISSVYILLYLLLCNVIDKKLEEK